MADDVLKSSGPRELTGPLAVRLAGLTLRNPLVLAAGTHGTLDEFADVCDLSRVGAVVSKSITPEPRAGNNTWRILPHPSPMGLGMLNAIGLANPGIDAFVRDYLPRGSAMPAPLIVSAAGFAIDDYVRVASIASAHAATTAIELNLSCPNVKHGTEFGASPTGAREVVAAVRAACPAATLFVKLSPVAPDLASIAKAIIDAGATSAAGKPPNIGLTLGNTVPALAIDVESRRPLLANTTGGLSGPAIHSASVRAVWEVHNKVGRDAFGPATHLPIIGLGGVSRWQDAAEFILAGATAVGLGTILLADPRAPISIARNLDRWVKRQGCASISELVGAMRSGPTTK
jgi:dihydroorotate dehydrogenase (NAD+) catalytic subunit